MRKIPNTTTTAAPDFACGCCCHLVVVVETRNAVQQKAPQQCVPRLKMVVKSSVNSLEEP